MENVAQPVRRPDDVAVVADTSGLLMSNDSPFTKIARQLDQIRSNFQVLLAPGEKQFKDLPKRVRLMVVSFGIPLVYALLKVYVIQSSTSILIWGVIAFLLGLLTYWGIYWGVKGQVRQESYWSVLLLPGLFVISNILFLSTVFVGEINRLYLWGLFALAIITFMTILYILSLAVNILNVSLFYTIPLSRLGESVAYICSVIMMFLISYTLFEHLLPYLIALNFTAIGILLGGTFVLLGAIVTALWNYFVPYSRGFWLFVLLSTMFLTISLAISTTFLPFAWISGVVHGMVSYVFMGYIIHKEQNTLNKTIIWELIAVVAVAFFTIIWA